MHLHCYFHFFLNIVYLSSRILAANHLCAISQQNSSFGRIKITKLKELNLKIYENNFNSWIFFPMHRRYSHSCCWTIDVAYPVQSYHTIYITLFSEDLTNFVRFPLFQKFYWNSPPPHLNPSRFFHMQHTKSKMFTFFSIFKTFSTFFSPLL